MGERRGLRIDWGGADVHDGALCVEIDGEIPHGFGKRFQSVLALLRSRGESWGRITVRKGRIEVSDVLEGAEGDLRQVLEAVLQQVESDLTPELAGAARERLLPQDPRELADRRMTARFREFAAAEREPALPA